MKTFLLSLLFGVGLTGAVFGQTAIVQPPIDQSAIDPATAAVGAAQQPAVPPAQAQGAPVADGQAATTTTATAPFSADELDQLLGPIALYPDPLIGMILPASTAPSEIVLANRYLQENGDPDQIANQPWDDSVKALTHYPDVLKWLDDNLAWTSQLGDAYAAQPADVMNSIQRLRVQAKSDGALVSTDQQQVGVDDGEIVISPTDVGTLYVPQYDPNTIYGGSYGADYGPVITFGAAYATGPWLYYWPNWRRHGIYTGNWSLWWNFKGGSAYASSTNVRPWTPNPNRPRPQFRSQSVVAATGAPARPAIVRPHLQGSTNGGPVRHVAGTTFHTGAVSPGAGSQAQQGQSQSTVPHGVITAAPHRPVAVQPPAQAEQPPVIQHPPVYPVYPGHVQGGGFGGGGVQGQQFGGHAAGVVTGQPSASAPVWFNQGQGAVNSGAGGGHGHYGR